MIDGLNSCKNYRLTTDRVRKEIKFYNTSKQYKENKFFLLENIFSLVLLNLKFTNSLVFSYEAKNVLTFETVGVSLMSELSFKFYALFMMFSYVDSTKK